MDTLGHAYNEFGYNEHATIRSLESVPAGVRQSGDLVNSAVSYSL